jgi:hypothetical protein
LPSLTAATPPELQPPAPPAPPPPSQQPAPLDLSVAPPGVSISTPTALIQPPTPPVNPAPPGGARREARQRQAAAQKGGADSSEESQDHNVDTANSPSNPTGAAMTRIDPGANQNPATRFDLRRPAPSFTVLATDRSSGLGQGVLWGAGLGLAALTLALGWTHGRPTPRTQQPPVPAPGWANTRRRR